MDFSSPPAGTKVHQDQQKHNSKKPSKKNNRGTDDHAFLDATSTISVPAFGDARLPELARLYFAQRHPDTTLGARRLKAGDANEASREEYSNKPIHERQNLLSGGGKWSSRHLRRRTTAVRSKVHRHRYPCRRRSLAAAAAASAAADAATGNRGGGAKKNSAPRAPPVYKGATRKTKRKKRDYLDGRRLRWLLAPNGKTDDATDDNNTQGDKLCNQPPQSWLVTHRWHAKRFHVLSAPPPSSKNNDQDPDETPVLGGWTGIPLVHTNRGPRAALRLSQNKDRERDGPSAVMVRDATWETQPILVSAMVAAHNKAKAKDKTKGKGKAKPRSRRELQGFLLQHLRRICPGLPQPEAATTSFFYGRQFLDDTLYEPDAFPSRAIGPVSCRMLPPPSNNGDDKHTELVTAELRCHPSSRGRLEGFLRLLAEGIPKDSPLELKAPPRGATGSPATEPATTPAVPRICFRLYGTASLDALNRVLRLAPNHPEGDDLSKIIENQQQQQQLRHGSIIHLEKVSLHGEGSATRAAAEAPPDNMLLVYRAPRPLDCPANRAISGWEVYASDPAFARALWLALVTLDASRPEIKRAIRGCCAIGLIEEAHMKLECEPPIMVFPRDCVDTPDASRYWLTSQPLSKSSRSLLPYRQIRQLLEGGWGRLPVDKESRLDKLEAVDFGALVAASQTNENDKESKTTNNIVAVRGAFVQPFVDAIAGSCGSYPSEEDPPSKENQRKRRRHRRPARPPGRAVSAPPLSSDARAALAGYCHTMLASLTLPAVVLVHVRALDGGTICAGMAIVGADKMDDDNGGSKDSNASVGENDDNDAVLGWITAGSFSTSRGVCHGIGAVGAVRLLGYLERIHSSSSSVGYGRVVTLANGRKSLQLLVCVGREVPGAANSNHEGNSEDGGGGNNNGGDASATASQSTMDGRPFIGCDASLSILI